ncbi:MAG: hypothetical protein ABR503_03175 [Chitinophagaceae bacterium]
MKGSPGFPKIFFFLLTIFIYSGSISQMSGDQKDDSVTWQASTKYADPSFFKRLFLGRNYRKEWETPVKLPVFHLKGMGFKIKELGGGQQTKSLRLEDKNGRLWTLRTIDKDVEKALPPFLRNTIAEKITQDMVSAAHPYAPLTVTVLSNAMGIIAPVPKIYFVPNDPDLDSFIGIFANTLCLLEQREPTPDKSNTESTEKVLEEIIEENDHLIIQKAVLRARLLDMLIGDWDRHSDQWTWGVVEQNGVDYYYAIPRDRDQAYFYSQGLLVKIARKIALPHLVGFRKDLSKLRKLNNKSWQFDKTFLNELDRQEWKSTIKLVQSSLSDSVISKAIHQLPPEVYPISGPQLEVKLKGRRNDLLNAGLKYYDIISKSVTISGTDEAEIFKITGDNEQLTVKVFDKKDGKEGRQIYQRTFIPIETSEINLSGFGGADIFFIEENVSVDIRIKLMGGEGKDVYNVKGDLSNTIYDAKADDNVIENKSNTRVKIR